MYESGRKALENHPTDISFEDMLQHTAKTSEEHRFMEWLKSGMEGWDSSPLSDLSARNHFWEHDDPLFTGGDGFVCNGFFTMVQEMAKGLKIHFGECVTRIVQGDRVRVETNRGYFEGDYVICTLPLGVLKEGKKKIVRKN
jgi:monoamine oxidase